MPTIGILGVFLIAASSLWRVVVGIFVPGYEARRREYLDEIRSWQAQQLQHLRGKSFTELAALPARSELAGPTQFRREAFAVIRTAGENGGVEVGVAHFHRILGVDLSRIMPAFEMLPSGSIVEADHKPDD